MTDELVKNVVHITSIEDAFAELDNASKEGKVITGWTIFEKDIQNLVLEDNTYNLLIKERLIVGIPYEVILVPFGK